MLLVLLVALSFGACFGSENTNYYCADLPPQPHVDIEHLMGMWYGIEVISHKPRDSQDFEDEPVCPILQISKDDHNDTVERYYDRTYGANYGYNAGHGNYHDNYQDSTYPYDRNEGYHYVNNPPSPPTQRERTRYRPKDTRRRLEDDLKRLRLFVSDNGKFATYYLRYNESNAGFWFSSGPHNGSSLERKFDHFAGTVQVLKAVGSHLVLVFCHRMPEKKLYTIILSREQSLSQLEIHGVHNLLDRRDLSTANVKKVCTNASSEQVLPKINSVLAITLTTCFFFGTYLF